MTTPPETRSLSFVFRKCDVLGVVFVLISAADVACAATAAIASGRRSIFRSAYIHFTDGWWFAVD